MSQIPYSVYDIYVYFSSDTAGRTGSVSDGSTTYYFSMLGSAAISGANALFTQTTDTLGTNPGANYAVFAGLSGASQTLTFKSGAGGTALTGAMALAANGTLALPFSPTGWFETTAAALLELALSGSTQVSGAIGWVAVS